MNLKKDHVLLHNMSKKCRVCTTPLAHLANSFRLLQWKKDNLFTICIKVGLSNTNFYFLIIIIIIISIEGEVTCRRYGQQPEKKEKLKQPAYRSNDVQFIQQGVWKFIFPSKFKRGSMLCDSRIKNYPKRRVTVVEY